MKFAFDLRRLSFIGAALLLLLCCAASAAAADEGTPKAVVEENTHEFGAVYEGKDIFHTFAIKNQGEAVLEIQNVRTG